MGKYKHSQRLWPEVLRFFARSHSGAGALVRAIGLVKPRTNAKIKEAAKQDPGLAARIDAIKGRDGKQASYLVQVYEARSRKLLGSLLVDTGKLSFFVKRAVAAGDTVLVSDSQNRTLVYSLKSGEQRGKVVGNARAVSGGGDKMLVENGDGVVDVYDTSSLQSLAHFNFPSRLAHAEFTAQGNLMVLTADQTFYQFDLTAPQNASVH